MSPFPMVVTGWGGLHPLMMYLAIVLFLLAPVFLLLAIFTHCEKHNTLLLSALLAMILGIASMYAAVETTQGVAPAAARTEGAQAIVEHHRKLAGLAWDSFALATLLLGVMFYMHRGFHLNVYELTAVLPVGFVVFYGLGLYWLVKAACQGERIIHELEGGG